ncbi:MAG: protein translocase subunit SecD [Nitrospirae bacterium]|nr:protein translocase subunit SecD [Nitrospirota bacterium]
MKRGIRGRLLLLSITVLISIIFFLPSTPVYPLLPDWWKNVMPSRGITLGLDLQGGIHMVLEVEEEKAVENLVERTASSIKDFLDSEKLPVASVKRVGPSDLIVTLSDPGKKADVAKKIEANYSNFIQKESQDNDLVYHLREGEVIRIKDSATTQALETIRNRIDQFGVAEPLIQRQGARQIVIQLPGVKDSKRAKDLIGKTALLEFKLLDEDHPMSRTLPLSITTLNEETFLAEYGSKVPEGDELMFERLIDSETGEIRKRPYLIKKRIMMTGDVLTDARVSIGQFNEPYVSISMDGAGAQVFERITGENVKKRLAIILDNNVYSAPVIQDRISGGNAQITGSFTTQEANDLAIVLRAGALPAPVRTIQDLTVGPSLGEDSIRMGIRATVLAGILVILFMMIYYRMSGMVADMALVLNLIVLMGGLAAMNATLTLPGIAGIILTIGMGVDSNVLIFERIREELRQGKPVRLAIDGGYDKAFLTIVDSHVTTLITAVVLFLFGTGPIKGFAVSLSLGIAINLFTALVGTKIVFDFINSRWKLQRLSI